MPSRVRAPAPLRLPRPSFLILSFLILASSLELAALAQLPAPQEEQVVAGQIVPPERVPNRADYRLDARLDPEARSLEVRQVLRWHNRQAQPAQELWFHLYWNAWRNNRSTWMQGNAFRRRSTAGDELEKGDWGFQEVRAVRLRSISAPAAQETAETVETVTGLGEGASATGPLAVDLTGGMHFASPDDGNPEDRTVLVVPLPQPVPPGGTVEVEIDFLAHVPRTFARTGVQGDFFFIAHWFPKLGVFEPEGWNCHQFHVATEFFSDFGDYEVRLTLPERFVVGATGRRVETTPRPDGMVTHLYRQEDVHGFAWTASPDYLELESRFEEPGLPPVDMRLLLQPEHEHQAERHFEATRAALKFYGRWYGPYPYGHVTIVDPAWGSGAGGMEYPTLFTAGTRWLNPAGGGSPEGVTIHECGHQFWYGLVANNEFEHAWLDEGLNTFSTARAYEEAFGERRYVKRYLSLPKLGGGGFLPVLFKDLRYTRAGAGNRLGRYRSAAPVDVQATPSYLYFPGTSSAISYNKTALWLATLERQLGWDTLQEILSTFFQRWRFRHPRPEDFFAVADEVVGRRFPGEDLGWFFDQVFYDSVGFDYAVTSATSKPRKEEGLFGEEGALEARGLGETRGGEAKKGEGKVFRSEVVVQRQEPGVFPVEVLLRFEDGSELRRVWEGEDPWLLIVEERPSRLEYAVVDPQRKLLLDLDYRNNSRLVKERAALPAHKWGSRWLVWLQDLLTTLTFFT